MGTWWPGWKAPGGTGGPGGGLWPAPIPPGLGIGIPVANQLVSHISFAGKLELPEVRPWLARALAWPGLLAFCPSKSPSGRC